MAFIKKIEVSTRKSLRIYRTQVICFYAVDRLPLGRSFFR